MGHLPEGLGDNVSILGQPATTEWIHGALESHWESPVQKVSQKDRFGNRQPELREAWCPTKA